jgi:hypothetical protein
MSRFGQLSTRGATVPPSPFPLSIAAGGRYLQDATGRPFPLFVESGWEHSRLLPSGWQSYLNAIAALGYNGTFNQGPMSPDFRETDAAGNPWFNAEVSSNVVDITQPNAAAFANCKAAMVYAQSKGICSLFWPAYAGFGGTQEGILDALLAATDAQVETYGAYLGSLINSVAGAIVVLGGDDIPSATDLETYRRLTVGIKTTDRAGRIYTWHGARTESSYDCDAVTGGYIASLGVPFIDFAYSRESGSLAMTHDRVLTSYAVPYTVFLGEGHYENSASANADAVLLRRQFYGAWFSGACGTCYGDEQRYLFESGWEATLSRSGLARDVIGIAFIKARAWWTLVPSTGTGLVTSGGGTINTTGYKPRALSSDSKLGLVHVTDGSSTTINKALFSGSFSARWFDPTNGTYAAIGTGIANSGTQAYSTPGSNAAGATDWIWVGEVP